MSLSCYSVEEVRKYLLDNDFPNDVVDNLAGKSKSQCFLSYRDYTVAIENSIDGLALVSLINDFD